MQSRSRCHGNGARIERWRLAFRAACVPTDLIPDLDLRFEVFGEECLRAGDDDTIAGGEARCHKPSASSGTRHYKLPTFKLHRRDLHISPCAVGSPDYCCLRNHDTRFGGAGRFKISSERRAGAKGKFLSIDLQQEALALKMRIDAWREPDRVSNQRSVVKTKRRDPRLRGLLCQRLTRRQRYSD